MALELDYTVLVSGSLAYDTILTIGNRFKDHILPRELDTLNVAFEAQSHRREFGGVAGNITYNLALLGDRGCPLSTVGQDFELYAEWLHRAGVPLSHVKYMSDEVTAQAFITTDAAGNQFTVFHPGAMRHAARNPVPELSGPVLGLVSPNEKQAMLEHARQFHALGTPFIFDPGQALPLFTASELNELIERSTWMTLNWYEWLLFQERMGRDAASLLSRLQALIITKGAEGSVIFTQETGASAPIEIPVASPRAVTDPTGCGDAYRAGIIHGILHRLPWEETGRIGALMSAIKIECRGPQNHKVTREELARRSLDNFGFVPHTLKPEASLPPDSRVALK